MPETPPMTIAAIANAAYRIFTADPLKRFVRAVDRIIVAHARAEGHPPAKYAVLGFHECTSYGIRLPPGQTQDVLRRGCHLWSELDTARSFVRGLLKDMNPLRYGAKAFRPLGGFVKLEMGAIALGGPAPLALAVGATLVAGGLAFGITYLAVRKLLD